VTSYSCTTERGGTVAVFISQANEQGGRFQGKLRGQVS
jgi:hypothetical protein